MPKKMTKRMVNGLVYKAFRNNPWHKYKIARVPPQPGQGMPVSFLKGQKGRIGKEIEVEGKVWKSVECKGLFWIYFWFTIMNQPIPNANTKESIMKLFPLMILVRLR